MTTDDRVKQYDSFMSKAFLFKYPLTYIPVKTLEDLGFFTAPASIRFHGNYTGGLFDHSFLMAKALVELTEKLDLKWERPESPYIVGMYHDLCKCDLYVRDPESGQWNYNRDVINPDHGAYSVIIAQKHINLTDEEIACIRWHMGAYEKDPAMWDYLGRAIEKYHNVLFTHTADMIASRCLGV